jgi:hypothetical protein
MRDFTDGNDGMLVVSVVFLVNFILNMISIDPVRMCQNKLTYEPLLLAILQD